MPYYHCKDCHHEFEHIPDIDYEVQEDWSIAIHQKENMPKCDWCKGDSYILEEETSFERAMRPENLEKMLGELCAYEYQKSCNTRKH